MKTIATAALFLTLTASAWADEPKGKQPALNDEPIVLSEAEMDGVTAAGVRPRAIHGNYRALIDTTPSSSTSTNTAVGLGNLIVGYNEQGGG